MDPISSLGILAKLTLTSVELILKLHEASSDNSVYWLLVKNVYCDIQETIRERHERFDILRRQPEKLAWIDESIKDTLEALQDAASLLEGPRFKRDPTYTHPNKISFGHRIEWAISSKEAFETRQKRLATCHVSLALRLNYLHSLPRYFNEMPPVVFSPPLHSMSSTPSLSQMPSSSPQIQPKPSMLSFAASSPYIASTPTYFPQSSISHPQLLSQPSISPLPTRSPLPTPVLNSPPPYQVPDVSSDLSAWKSRLRSKSTADLPRPSLSTVSTTSSEKSGNFDEPLPQSKLSYELPQTPLSFTMSVPDESTAMDVPSRVYTLPESSERKHHGFSRRMRRIFGRRRRESKERGGF